MIKVYVASSWRNERQQEVVAAIRKAGFEVYDFKKQDSAFEWSDIWPDWRNWQWKDFWLALVHPLAEKGFDFDYDALRECDCYVLLLPGGKSACLELGFAAGLGLTTFVMLDGACEPELMYGMADYVCVGLDELIGHMECFYLCNCVP